MIQARTPDGVIHQFPDGTPDAVIDKAMKAYTAEHQGGGGRNAFSALLSGSNKGFSGVADTVIGATPIGGVLGTMKMAGQMKGAVKPHATQANLFSDFTDAAKRVAYRPQGALAETADTLGTMLPNALAGTGNMFARAANVIVPTLTTEGAGLVADMFGASPKVREAARAGGGVVGAGLASIRAPNLFSPKALPEGSHGRVLADIGVSTTPAQRMGRATKGVEDIGKRAPIVGQAMAGYQDRQIEQLNRGIGLKALEPIGGTLGKDVKPGFQMVKDVERQLNDVYTEAGRLVPKVSLDEQLVQDAAEIGARKVNLSESEARQWDSIVKDRLTRLQSGETSGTQLKEIQSEIRGLAAEQKAKGNVSLGSMLDDLGHAIMGPAARANPRSAELIRKADAGWRTYSIMNDAAAAARQRGGVFLPGQLSVEVGRAGKRLGPNMTGKGEAPLQDISTAASQTIPDSYGNPGTANTLLLSGGAGSVGAALMHPATAAPVLLGGAALTAAATPYFLAGRKVLESLPARPSPQELAAAEQMLTQLSQHDPEVTKILDAIKRLGSTAAIPAAASIRAAETQPQ